MELGENYRFVTLCLFFLRGNHEWKTYCDSHKWAIDEKKLTVFFEVFREKDYISASFYHQTSRWLVFSLPTVILLRAVLLLCHYCNSSTFVYNFIDRLQMFVFIYQICGFMFLNASQYTVWMNMIQKKPFHRLSISQTHTYTCFAFLSFALPFYCSDRFFSASSRSNSSSSIWTHVHSHPQIHSSIHFSYRREIIIIRVQIDFRVSVNCKGFYASLNFIQIYVCYFIWFIIMCMFERVCVRTYILRKNSTLFI